MSHYRKFSILVFLTLIYTGLFAQQVKSRLVPVPVPAGTLALRVLVVNNPRFPEITNQQINELLLNTVREVQYHFAGTISFVPPVYEKISQTISRLNDSQKRWIKSQSLDLQNKRDLTLLKDALAKDLTAGGGNLNEITNYSRRYVVRQPLNSTLDELATTIAETQAELADRWQREKLSDGLPMLGKEGYAEYLTWLSLGLTGFPYEIIITNQPIVSAEKFGAAVHSALRGGVSNGLTNSSAGTTLGTFSVLSTFAFFNDSQVTTMLRGGETYSSNQALKYAAALLVHELGHQIFHLGHPFDNAACIMRPPQQLLFRQWFDGLDPQKCRMNSNLAMTPGLTINFTDIRK